MGVYNKFNVKTATTANHKEKELSNKKYGMYSINCQDCNMIYHSVRKVSNLTFFYENLVDFNEACLHEATFNLHKHA